MKNLIVIILILFAFQIVKSQEVSPTPTALEVANQRLDKVLTLLDSKEKEIADLKEINKKLEALQATPCSTAQVTAANTLIYWHEQFEKTSDKNSRKEIGKTLNVVRKQQKQIIVSQCGIKEANKWYWEMLKIASVAGILIFK